MRYIYPFNGRTNSCHSCYS